MYQPTSSFLRKILTTAACAAVALCGTLPASAHPHDKATAAPRHAERAAPVRAERAAPVRTERAAPVRVERAAPVRVERAAPVRVRRAAPVRAERAAPVRVERAEPVRVERRAPVRVERAAPVRVERAAPVRVERRAPVRVERNAPFEQRVAPERNVRTIRTAPFEQFVREPRFRREVITRTVVASPLMRAAYAARARTIPVAYHPAYLAGRVIRVTEREVVLQPPTGTPLTVYYEGVPNPTAVLPVGDYVTVPATYSNGVYDLYTSPTYMGYNYTTPQYCYAPSSTLYTALLPTVLGALTGGQQMNATDLAAVAASALASGSYGNSCTAYPPAGYAPSYPVNYAPSYPAPVSYAPSYPVTYATTAYPTSGYGYGTPYDNCVWTDSGTCAPVQPAYSSYGPYGAYAPQQVQGLVIGKTGNMLMVVGANGSSPTFVDASAAMQNGYTVNGPVAVGQVIDAYGFYNGNTFYATTLV